MCNHDGERKEDEEEAPAVVPLPVRKKIRPNTLIGLSEESKRRALDFKPRSTDVFVATVPKSGTTLLQWLCHLLRCHLEPSALCFQDIYQVSPWLELAFDLDQDLENQCFSKWGPRVFKSHLRLAALPEGGKFICTVRKPEDIARSFYSYLCAKGDPSVYSMTSVSEFIINSVHIKQDMTHGGSIWDYFEDFYLCCTHPRVLVLVYEDLENNIRGNINCISRFLGLGECSSDELDTITELCSKRFMSSEVHRKKFDQGWAYERAKKIGRIPRNAEAILPAPRVVISTRSKLPLTSEAMNVLEENWITRLAKPHGLKSYEALCEFVRKAKEQRFPC